MAAGYLQPLCYVPRGLRPPAAGQPSGPLPTPGQRRTRKSPRPAGRTRRRERTSARTTATLPLPPPSAAAAHPPRGAVGRRRREKVTGLATASPPRRPQRKSGRRTILPAAGAAGTEKPRLFRRAGAEKQLRFRGAGRKGSGGSRSRAETPAPDGAPRRLPAPGRAFIAAPRERVALRRGSCWAGGVLPAVPRGCRRPRGALLALDAAAGAASQREPRAGLREARLRLNLRGRG